MDAIDIVTGARAGKTHRFKNMNDDLQLAAVVDLIELGKREIQIIQARSDDGLLSSVDERRVAALVARSHELYTLIEEVPSRSIVGLRAKARAAKLANSAGDDRCELFAIVFDELLGLLATGDIVDTSPMAH